jgi:hypothetical protein
LRDTGDTLRTTEVDGHIPQREMLCRPSIDW